MSPSPVSVIFRLTIERPDGSIELFNIEKSPVMVGRVKSNDIIIKGDSAISREHCRFELIPGRDEVTISDLGSSNGTFLNGESVGPLPMPLAPGDKVQVGGTILRLSSHRPSIRRVTKQPTRAPTPVSEQPTQQRFGVPLLPVPGEEERTVFENGTCTCGRCGATINTKSLLSGDKVGCAQCRAVWKVP